MLAQLQVKRLCENCLCCALQEARQAPSGKRMVQSGTVMLGPFGHIDFSLPQHNAIKEALSRCTLGSAGFTDWCICQLLECGTHQPLYSSPGLCTCAGFRYPS